MAVPSPSTSATRRSPMEHPRHQYPAETAALRHIALSCGLVEHIKWGKPCFTHNAANVLLLQRFNAYFALLFFQGDLLDDPGLLLTRIGKHTRAARQLRITSAAGIPPLEPHIRAFIGQAKALAGRTALRTPATPPELPPELSAALQGDPTLRKAFAALTPGRQRGYVLQIAAAKQTSTRSARVAKFTPFILAGKGLHDR